MCFGDYSALAYDRESVGFSQFRAAQRGTLKRNNHKVYGLCLELYCKVRKIIHPPSVANTKLGSQIQSNLLGKALTATY